MKKVKNWMVILAVAVFIFNAAPARSQMSFVAGAIVGGLLFGDGDRAGTAASIIYILPEASKRVKNPLEIRMASVYGSFMTNYNKYIGQLTLRELFEKAVQDPKKYEILQVVRVFDGSSPHAAAIWFAYIEKESLLPLKQ